MKRFLSLLLCVLMTLTLAGCSKGGEEKFINVFLPGEYIDEDMVKDFEKETGIKVVLDTFDSNEAMYTSLAGGSTGYDIVIPSDYMIEKLIKEGMLQPLDLSLIDNLDGLYDGVKNMDYDPSNKYSVPYFWGNVGIVYDITAIDEADVIEQEWEVFKNTKYAGMTYLYDSVRDEFMIALKALGYSMNTENMDEINEAAAWLTELTSTMDTAIETDGTIDGLAFQEGNQPKYMSMMYSGDAAYILSENENMRFYAPEKAGTNYWVDAMCVLKDSEKMDLACEFINYIISYDGSYANSSAIGYSSVNAEALEDLSADEFDGNDAYVPRTKTEMDETFHDLNETVRKDMGDLWVRVKNASSK